MPETFPFVSPLKNEIVCLIGKIEALDSKISRLIERFDEKEFIKGKESGKNERMVPPRCGLRYEEVREYILDLRGRVFTINQIVKAIKDRWPDAPEYHASKSTIHRFLMRAKQGMLDHYDFDLTKQ